MPDVEGEMPDLELEFRGKIQERNAETAEQDLHAKNRRLRRK